MSCLVGGNRQIQVGALVKAVCDKLKISREMLKCRHHRLEFTGASIVESCRDCAHLQFLKYYFFSLGALKAPKFTDILV